MPTLNLSELACDPELMSSIVRLRPTTANIPGTEGRTRTTYVQTPLMAIVQPADRPDELESVPDGERMSNWLMVICTEPVLLAGPESVGDIVVYDGGKYRVMKVEPYRAFGYYMAICQEYHAATPTTAAPADDKGGA